MLFGRNMQVSFVKPRKDGEPGPTFNLEDLDYDKIGMIAKDTVKITAVSIVAVGAAFFAMSTARQILINVTNPANYR
jgi:hypothetical protein